MESKQVPFYEPHQFWIMSYENRMISLKTLLIQTRPKRSMLDLKLLFFRTLLDWFSMWRNHHFPSILDLLDFYNVRFWYVRLCILLVYWGVSLFLISMNLYYLQKKRVNYKISKFKRKRERFIVHKIPKKLEHCGTYL